jgi:hypothetical protein
MREMQQMVEGTMRHDRLAYEREGAEWQIEGIVLERVTTEIEEGAAE